MQAAFGNSRPFMPLDAGVHPLHPAQPFAGIDHLGDAFADQRVGVSGFA